MLTSKFWFLWIFSASGLVYAQIDEVEGSADQWEWKTPAFIKNQSKAQRVVRNGNNVSMDLLVNEQTQTVKTLKLARIDQAADTAAAHDCSIKRNQPKVALQFTPETFERIVPPSDEDPPATTPAAQVDALVLTERNGNQIFFFGKLTVQQVSGRSYLNGEVHQVFTKLVTTMKKDDKTFTWTPQASPKYQNITPTSVPRFDGQMVYSAQFRVVTGKGDDKRHLAVVAIDLPGIRLGSLRAQYIDEAVSTKNEITFEVEFQAYFFVDCDADGTPELPTHRIDWKMKAQLKTGDTHPFQGLKGKSEKDDTTKANKNPDHTGPDSSHKKADDNDPGPQGWDPFQGGKYDKKTE